MHFFNGQSSRRLGLLAAVITVVIWTSFIVIARASSQASLTSLDLGWARVVGAGLVLLPVGKWLTRQGGESSFFGLSPLSFHVTAVCGLFGGAGYAALVYSGFFYAPAAHASVLLPGSLPLWTALLATLFIGEQISRTRWMGLAFILAGGGLVGGSSLLSAFEGGQIWKGDLLFMLASFSWSSYAVLARRYAVDPVRATVAITVFAVFTFVPAYALLVALGLLQSKLVSAPIGELMFQMAYQGLGTVVIAGVAFTQMVRHYGAVRTTMITALVPGLSALGAVLFLGEPLHWHLLAGLLLVTIGILFGVRQRTPSPSLAPAQNS